MTTRDNIDVRDNVFVVFLNAEKIDAEALREMVKEIKKAVKG